MVIVEFEKRDTKNQKEMSSLNYQLTQKQAHAMKSMQTIKETYL